MPLIRLVFALVVIITALATSAIATENYNVCFSPRGGCTEVITRTLAAAKTSVFVQAYSFTSVPIAKALIDAHRRGVKVSVVLDKSQRGERYTAATTLLNAGIRPLIDNNHAIAHNKVMVVDGQIVVTGSFNFTKAAEESNAENLLIIQDGVLATKYMENWNAHAAHSEQYTGPTQTTARSRR